MHASLHLLVTYIRYICTLRIVLFITPLFWIVFVYECLHMNVHMHFSSVQSRTPFTLLISSTRIHRYKLHIQYFKNDTYRGHIHVLFSQLLFKGQADTLKKVKACRQLLNKFKNIILRKPSIQCVKLVKDIEKMKRMLAYV